MLSSPRIAAESQRHIERDTNRDGKITANHMEYKNKATKISMAAVFVVMAATLLQSSYAETHTVGDDDGWQIPFGDSEFYDNWAEDKDFVVGDRLVFNFTTGEQDVAEVIEAAYDACTPFIDTITRESDGPASIRLVSSGEHYFICTFPGHCFGGQKLKINVQDDEDNEDGDDDDEDEDDGEDDNDKDEDNDDDDDDDDDDDNDEDDEDEGDNEDEDEGEGHDDEEEKEAPAPSPSSASFLVATLSVVFMSAALALLC